MRGVLAGATLLVTALSIRAPRASAQTASEVVAAASRAMGVEGLGSITYSGSARTGAFGQSKAIGEPMGAVNLSRVPEYTRTILLGEPAAPTALVSRATGPVQPPAVPGVPPQPAGVFIQNVSGAGLANAWTLALTVWTTPWGFLKGAATNDATVRRERGRRVVSFSPAAPRSPSGQRYTVTGWLDDRNLVTRVATHVEHAVVGDLPVEFEYTGYRSMGGVQVPTRIVQRQAGLPTFELEITAATPNPANLAELLTPPSPPPAGPPPVERIGDGVYKIGGNYASLAVDMGDHVLVVESGQNEARGLAVIAAARQAIPGKPVRFVVNSHPHFDHAGDLAAVVAGGATVLTHRNNEPALERFLAGPRTLIGDSLSRVARRRSDVVVGVGDRDVRRGANGKVVELHRLPNEHSDGLLAVYLPAERALWTADVTAVNPNASQLGVLRSAVEALDRLGLDWDTWIPAHPPNPDRRLTRADVLAAVGR